MGNRAKRVKLAKRLKELGYGKLYSGNKKVAWKRLYSHSLDTLLWKLQFAPGEVVNDCDGFNHRIVKWLVKRYHFASWYETPVRGWFFDVDQFEREDGYWSCGCWSGPEAAQPRDHIEAFMKAYVHDEQLREGGWLKDGYYDKIRITLNKGEHICDERGLLLPEFRRRPDPLASNPVPEPDKTSGENAEVSLA